MSPREADLIAKARGGDGEAFAELYEPLAQPLAAFLYRLTAERQDAEDLGQETALRALEAIAQFEGASSFRTWIFRLAVCAALEYLQGRKPWHPDAQIRAGRRTGEDSAMRRTIQKLHKSALHASYEIREHIDFCFTAMGRSLPAHEEAALLLAEVHGFSAEEAAETLGISAPALQFRIQQARRTLVDHFEDRCGLINKDGTCAQCAGLDTLLHGDHRHTERALFQIGLEPRPTPIERAGTFERRLAIVRSIDPLHAEGARLHELLMKVTRDMA